MITLRRAEERRHARGRKQEAWLSFYAQDRGGPLTAGFGILEILNEDHLQPGACIPLNLHPDTEIITYVRKGTLTYKDTLGHSGVIQAGEFLRLTDGRGFRQNEANASLTNGAQVLRIGLHVSKGKLQGDHEQKRFSAAERRGGLCVVASLDARRGSLRIHQDASIYSAMLQPGRHVIHELTQGRSAWLHLVQGEVTLGDLVLTTGDGAGVTAERAVSFMACEDTEILLLDLGGQSSSEASLEGR